MSRRSPLPPPPPPVELRSWPDRQAMLADRAVVLGELVRIHVGHAGLAMLWLWGMLAALGWSFVGGAIVSFEEPSDPFAGMLGLVGLVLGACLLVPPVTFVAVGLARDRQVRRLLLQWGALDRDPAGDPRLRVPGVSLLWMLTSFALCALGLYVCVVVPAGAEAGEETYGEVSLFMGLGLICWLTGLIGVVKAFAHRRWVLRVLVGTHAREPVRDASGADRPAS
ncbi:hypothetical protein F0344_13675 [Streptomyces finlayi]|uniref:Uncharacterized protein n=1 Tax=Streptomyces finlayi TaxID=67296 RepID=A0A7G7BJL9_9ACTN|nr:hypothetical protein [Streptomyces finlayi]QNE75534.1 hypothetical protein F0344_13675 [Streptomyces finlayi]